MDYFTAVLNVVKLLWNPLARQISYVKNLKRNVENLRKESDELTCEESNVTKEVERAKLQQRDPKAKLNYWLKDLNDVKNEVSDIEKEFKENRRYLKGCLPNYYGRRKLSKRALETTSKVKKNLKGKGFSKDVVVVDQPPPTPHTLLTPSLRAKTSAEIISEQILVWINDAKIEMVGVYGIGGIGKTTIMININNRLKDAKLFQSIIWVTVFEDLNLKRVQTDIAKKVELDFKGDDDEVSRVEALHEALINRQKFLLIQNDMWKAFSLKQVGIPKPSEENSCKIALTSRSLDVCHRMKTDKNIKVEELSKEEACDLFKDHLGSNVVLASNVQIIVKLVAEECRGLPLKANCVVTITQHMTRLYGPPMHVFYFIYPCRPSVLQAHFMENEPKIEVCTKLKWTTPHETVWIKLLQLKTWALRGYDRMAHLRRPNRPMVVSIELWPTSTK